MSEENRDGTNPPPAAEPPIPPGVKSRAIGCCLIVGGAVMLGLILAFDAMPLKLFAALVAFGTVGLMMGFGMIVVPWTDEMFAMNDTDDLGKFFGAMTGFWKVWFPLSLVVMLVVMFAALILAG